HPECVSRISASEEEFIILREPPEPAANRQKTFKGCIGGSESSLEIQRLLVRTPCRFMNETSGLKGRGDFVPHHEEVVSGIAWCFFGVVIRETESNPWRRMLGIPRLHLLIDESGYRFSVKATKFRLIFKAPRE